MDDMKYNPAKHTVHFFEQLSEQFDGNKSKMASHLGINRTKLYRWMEKAEKYKEIIIKDRQPRTRKSKQTRVKIPTINQLFEFIKKQPDHVHYAWFMKHMNVERKHYHAAIQKTLDVVNEYQ